MWIYWNLIFSHHNFDEKIIWDEKLPQTYIKVTFIIIIFVSFAWKKFGENSWLKIVCVHDIELETLVFEKLFTLYKTL